MTEVLSFLSVVPWPGVIATGILALSHCYRAWLGSRRISLRVGDIQIEATATRDVLRILQGYERFASQMAQARDRSIPRRRDTGGDSARLGSSRT